MSFFIVLLALFLGNALAAENEQSDNPRLVLLNGRTIDTRQEPQFQHESSVLTRGFDANEPGTFLLHVSEVPKQKESLGEYLAQNYQTMLLEYLPHNTYIIEGTPKMMEDLQARNEVRWVGAMKPEDKISVTDEDSKTLAELLVSLTHVYPKRSVAAIESIASSIHDMLIDSGELIMPDELVVTPVHSKTNRVGIKFGSKRDRDAAQLLIAKMTNIVRVEKRPVIHATNLYARGILEAGLHSAPDLTDPQSLLSTRHNLRGQRQVVGLSDSGLDLQQCFFQDTYGPSPFVKHVPDREPTCSDLNMDALMNARKVVSYVTYADSSDHSGHGTHVSGSIAGFPEMDQPTLREFEGVAGEAKLAFFDLGLVRNGTEILDVPFDLGSYLLHWAYVSGARVHTNSWGSSSPAYTSYAADMDEYMWEHKDFLVLVAAGNDGECAREQTVGSPATAKNIIAVGASMSNQESYRRSGTWPVSDLFDENDIAYFSSVGPTADGRIKPDLLAPGQGIFSSKLNGGSCSINSSSDLVQVLSGTSMASPLLAGTVTLVRQYFTEGFFPSGRRTPADQFSPSGSLMKATAIAGAVAMKGTRLSFGLGCFPKLHSFANTLLPDFHHGWGRTQLDRVLEFAEDASSADFHLHIPSLDTSRADTFGDEVFMRSGQSTSYKFCSRSARQNASQEGPSVLRVALVWTDAPGSVAAAVQLVNDLDLEVVYKNQTYLGNGKDTPDRLNPVEVVEIQIDGSASDVEVRVRAKAINVGPQPFSVVVVGAVRQACCADLKAGKKIDDGKQSFYDN